ncbi:MAG: chemotaxis protein CheW [Spirochaetota bacterium]|nr:chemotaxis protein CheW [Spirochaetota bacterium]
MSELLGKSRAVKKNKYITFFLDNEEYAVEIHKVKEIISMMHITQVPNTPEYIKGVLNLRGKVIPIIDLRLKFNMQFKKYGDRTSIIIMEIDVKGKKSFIGTIVDTVSEVLQVNDEDLAETPSFGVNINTNFVLGMAKVKDRVKILLDIDKVLTSDEINIINKLPIQNLEP